MEGGSRCLTTYFKMDALVVLSRNNIQEIEIMGLPFISIIKPIE
jgi:hypothetical protein